MLLHLQELLLDRYSGVTVKESLVGQSESLFYTATAHLALFVLLLLQSDSQLSTQLHC